LLLPGQSARIGQIMGDPQFVHRLEELGMRRGTPVEMVQSGSPCIIQLAGHKLCFRANEALHVLVQPGDVA
jgi:ferrous iron transport protein A